MMTFKDSQKYLDSVSKIIGELLFKRQVFNDFDAALRAQNAKYNFFITWCLQNYRDVLVVNLCKIIERDDECMTLKHFISFYQDPNNYAKLHERVKNAHRTHQGGFDEDLSGTMLGILAEIDFNKDAETIQDIWLKLKQYRHKRLCHNDKRQREITIPQIDEMHEYIDIINNMMKSYYKLFRVAVVDDFGKFGYGDFTLHLD